jgi:hypothetical protein
VNLLVCLANAFSRRVNTLSASIQALGFEIIAKGGNPRKFIIRPGIQTKLDFEDSEEPYFNYCYFCGQPIYEDNAVFNEFTENRPAHKSCYEQKFGELKQ